MDNSYYLIIRESLLTVQNLLQLSEQLTSSFLAFSLYPPYLILKVQILSFIANL